MIDPIAPDVIREALVSTLREMRVRFVHTVYTAVLPTRRCLK